MIFVALISATTALTVVYQVREHIQYKKLEKAIELYTKQEPYAYYSEEKR